MNDAAALQMWLDHVFDHPVKVPNWYWSDSAPKCPADRVRIPALMAETFERSGKLYEPFSNDQLEQGFWYLIGDASPGDFTETLLDEKIPVAPRLRAVRSFVPLFEQVMAVRCTSTLSHLNEQPANSLNKSCYMWWDLLRFSLWRPQGTTAPHDASLLPRKS